MKTFIATIGIGKGTWGKVKRICSEEWDKIIVLGNEWARDTFKLDFPFQWILLDEQKDVCQLVDDIVGQLPEDIDEIYVNLISGSGREHVALLSSLLANNKTFKTVCVCDDGIKYYGV
ncbi:MAG: hypothetical protein JW825_00400 [Candidatus Methanofastidiosa archaeon]|nr:hypothetical protein [Candidatus Methanofastidiosa archaeon]